LLSPIISDLNEITKLGGTKRKSLRGKNDPFAVSAQINKLLYVEEEGKVKQIKGYVKVGRTFLCGVKRNTLLTLFALDFNNYLSPLFYISFNLEN
jgi:hypothetical protein